MISKSLTKALENNGFTYSENLTADKNHVFGIYGGYLISVFEHGTKKFAFISFKFSENEENELIKESIYQSAKGSAEVEYVSFDIREDGLTFICNGNVPEFLTALDKAVSLLNENGIKGVEYCSKCGNKFGNRKPKKVTDGKLNHLMCEHCALEYLEESKKRSLKKAEATSNAKILPGILGSVGFGLIGCILYLFLYYVLSPALSKQNFSINEIRYIFCIAGFFVSMFSYYGYRIFCKRISISAYVTVPTVSLVFTMIGQYIGIVFEFISKSGLHLSALKNKSVWLVHLRNTVPSDISVNFPNYSEIFWKLFVISILFSAVGSAMFLLSLHDKTTVKAEPIEVQTISIK